MSFTGSTENNNENYKFELILSLDSNIIVHREFYGFDYNEKAKKSLNLYEEVKNICDDISQDLKIKSSDFLIQNQNIFNKIASLNDPQGNNQQHFYFRLKHNSEVFIERIFPAYYYVPNVRYTVDIRPMLSNILESLNSVLSIRKPKLKYLQYNL